MNRLLYVVPASVVAVALGLSSAATQDEQTPSPVAHEVTVRGRALSLPAGTALRVITANGIDHSLCGHVDSRHAGGLGDGICSTPSDRAAG